MDTPKVPFEKKALSDDQINKIVALLNSELRKRRSEFVSDDVNKVLKWGKELLVDRMIGEFLIMMIDARPPSGIVRDADGSSFEPDEDQKLHWSIRE